MKKRFVPIGFVLFLVLATATLGGAQAPGSGATTIPDHITLAWTADPARSMTITWRTDATVQTGFVQYQKGDKLSKEAMQVQAEARDFTADLGPSRLYTAALVNLDPNQKYSYRVGDGARWSAMNYFRTADPRARQFKFLVFGDSQAPLSDAPPYNQWRNTVQNAYNANPDAKWIVNVGDLVDWGQRGAHWNAWFAAAEGVVNRIPEMPTTGNHESYGSKDTTRPQYWTAQFALPQNGPEGLKGQAYSYDYGHVHFVVLDSQQEEQKQYGDILKAQQDWLEADLAASKAIWKIVFFHRPPYGVMANRPNEEIKKAFCPILEKHRVDLVFSGHDHGVARTHPIKNDATMENPSQGVVYFIVGQSGGKTYNNIEKTPWHAFFYNPLDQPNYFVVEVKDKQITVLATKQDGSVLDVFSIKK